MKKFLACIWGIVLILSCGVCSGFASNAPNGEPIKIGVMGMLTGDNSNMGTEAWDGARIFAKHANEDGGILGRPVEVIMEDEGFTEQSVNNTFLRILSRGDLAGIVQVSMSNNTLMAEQIIRRYNVPVICSGTAATISQLENPNLYQIRLNEFYTGKAMVDAAVDLIGMKKPALIRGTDSLGVTHADAIKAVLAERGIELAIEVIYTVGDKQFAPQLTQIANSGCDGIIAPGHHNETALIMLQSVALGLENLPKIGTSGATSSACLNVAKESANGWYAACDFFVGATDPLNQRLVADFRVAYNRDPDIFTGYCYDALACLRAAIELAKSADPVEVNKFIPQIKDVPGVCCLYSGNGHYSMGHSARILQIQGDNIVQIGEASRF